MRSNSVNSPAVAARFHVEDWSKDDDSYMYSDTDYTYVIVCTDTGDELDRFWGSSYSNSSGTTEDGARAVRIEGGEAAISNYDGTEKRVALPVDVRIVDGGAAI